MADSKENLSSILLAPVLIVSQWMIPGLGYVLIGQKARGITIGLTILVLFTMGLYIGGAKVVTPAESMSIQNLLSRPWYIGQCLVGPIGIFTGKLAIHPNFFLSHGKANEIGQLYTAVAGMMNLFTLIDLARSHRQKEEKP
jgi:hypothetical protein